MPGDDDGYGEEIRKEAYNEAFRAGLDEFADQADPDKIGQTTEEMEDWMQKQLEFADDAGESASERAVGELRMAEEDDDGVVTDEEDGDNSNESGEFEHQFENSEEMDANVNWNASEDS